MSTLCAICKQPISLGNGIQLAGARPSLFKSILARHPGVSRADEICHPCHYAEREQLLLARLGAERGELSSLEREVARRTAKGQLVAQQIDEEFDRSATLGNRAADKVASRGGSWTFVISLVVSLVIWMLLNAHAGTAAWDPYPFILLNLLLSCIAALQAPMILMSQNRAGQRDRSKAEQDFLVNLKAEIEIAALHEKMDHLLHVQWEELVEMQELQLEMLREIVAAKSATGDSREPAPSR